MPEILDWLARLATLDVAEPGSIKTHGANFRLIATAPLDFDDSFVRVISAEKMVESFGSLPMPMSVLSFMDTGESDAFGDQTLASQLGAVLTFATRRRVRVASAEVPLQMEGSSIMTFLPSTIVDREMLGPPEVDPKSAFERLLMDLAGLPDEHSGAIVSAIESHYAATQLYDIDLHTAHTLLVAGIETLSGHFEPEAATWSTFIDAERWDGFFEELALSQEQADRMRHELLSDKHTRLRQRFVSYVIDRLTPDFWGVSVRDYTPGLTMTAESGGEYTGMSEGRSIPIENFVPMDEAVLRRRLLATYDARSKFVHTGSKSIDQSSVLRSSVGSEMKRTEPIGFSGLRRILEWAIRHEISSHMRDSQLPSIRIRNVATSS
ncbi:hypothetical protein [Agromyces sp. NPDC057865]|uniref:hypothetical protein n=1 Tax=Agromyces sp. NPDC057865 TaxID=3346267 RepID=UPI00366F6245